MPSSRRAERWTVLPAATACIALAAGTTPLRGSELEPPREQIFFQDVEWSPDGEWIAFSRYSGGQPYDPRGWQVLVARPDGSSERVVASHATGVGWAPDSRRLVFASPRTGNWDLYVTSREDRSTQPLLSRPANDRAPSWSPDGEWIAFTSDRDGNSEIHVLAAAGGEPRRLTKDPAADHNPQWSPDGRQLAFYRARDGGGGDQVYVVAVDGSVERALTADAHLNIFPAFLPDGRIGFARRFRETGEERLVVIDPNGGSESAVGPAGAFFGRWSPDGRTVLLIAGDWPAAAVYSLAVETGRIQKILN